LARHLLLCRRLRRKLLISRLKARVKPYFMEMFHELHGFSLHFQSYLVCIKEKAMRRLFVLPIVVLFSATLTFAQGARDQDDHDDNGPIHAGYAVITPVVVTMGATTCGTTTTIGSSTSGLVVFETFGLRFDGGADTTQAGVLPPDLTTSAMLFVDSEGKLSKNVGVAIVNPNSVNVNVTLTLFDAVGKQAATANLPVVSHQQIAEMVTQLFSSPSAVPSDFTGTLIITSPLPVSVIGLRFRGANFSTLPATNLAGVTTALPNITPNAGGPGAILLPQFAAGGGWATELVMVNSSSTLMTVRVDLFKQDGTPLTTALNGQSASSFTGINICPGGVTLLAPRNAHGDDDF
jgi:hypothetical protein